MKDPLPRIRSRWLQFAISFVLLLLLFALMKYPPLETVIFALAFSALIMLGMRRHHQPLDCGAHEHQHRLCIRNLTLVVECSVCRQRWHLREPRPGHMLLTMGILGGICWFLLMEAELANVIPRGLCPLLMLAVALVIVLLVDGIYYLLLRREDPAKLAGAEFDKDI